VAVFTLVIGALLVASVLAVALEQERRPLWAAFALSGWGFLFAFCVAYVLDVDMSLYRLFGEQDLAIPVLGAAFVCAYGGATCARWLHAVREKEHDR
jgi:hypothetical protein